MKHFLTTLFLALFIVATAMSPNSSYGQLVLAQTRTEIAQTTRVPAVTPIPSPTTIQGEVLLEATTGADATMSAAAATPSAQVEQIIQEKKDKDITESGGKQKSRLAQYLDDNPPEALSWNNFIQHAIRYSVNEGVPANTIVLVLLFPLIAALIAASRHIIGLRGFGIYIPAVLSVALVSTGIAEGTIIFLAIVVTAIVAGRFIKKTKLSYLPRAGLLLWMVSLGILGTLFIAPVLGLTSLMSVNIFPILILVLLSENFLDAQTRSKQSEAIALTVETIALAAISGLILKWEPMQKLALSEPELLIICVALFNFVIGKFTGLRLTERLRFRNIIEE
jgi:hypothetical protein